MLSSIGTIIQSALCVVFFAQAIAIALELYTPSVYSIAVVAYTSFALLMGLGVAVKSVTKDL